MSWAGEGDAFHEWAVTYLKIKRLRLTAHSPSALSKVERAGVVRGTENTEKGMLYRLKPRVAGVPIISHWDKWTMSYEKISELIFSVTSCPYAIQAIHYLKLRETPSL